MARSGDKQEKVYSFEEAKRVCQRFHDTQEEFRKIEEEAFNSILKEVRAEQKANGGKPVIK